MNERDPYHDGERYVQERTRERAAALRNGPIVGLEIPPRALTFLAQQRMLVVGSVDAQRAVWASLLFGARGLVSSPDGQRVVIDRTLINASADDPTWRNLQRGAEVGLLAIELSSRRRLRINGVVRNIDDRSIDMNVHEAYPNCPKYIQRRHLYEDPGARNTELQPPAWGVLLDDVRSCVIQRADTLFVASHHPRRGVDVSHRGGAPGFVRIMDAKRLRIPDYSGNSMFNTLGNLVVDPRAGLVIPDFERGRLLQLTGTAVVHFDEEEDPAQPTGGTGRYWDFDVACWLELPMMTTLSWELLDFSPYNPRVLT